MPTEKRQRQKEGRRVRLEALRRQEKRRRAIRRSIWIVVIAGAIIGTIIPFLPSNKPTPLDQRLQLAANNAAVAAGCPSNQFTVLHPLTWKSPPRMTINLHRVYYATFSTTAGTFKVELTPKTAPVNVNNFVFLAQNHFFNCTDFNRVVTGFMDQGGNPTGGLLDKDPNLQSLPKGDTQGPGYSITQNEYPKLPKHGDLYAAGTVAIANGGPETNGSQFFIMASNYTSATTCAPGAPNCLPNTYTIIGHVISGLAVVKAINKEGGPAPVYTRGATPTQQAGGIPPRVINRVLSVIITSS